MSTDEDGWLVLDPAPSDSIRLQPRLPLGMIYQRLGPVQVPPGEPEATFS